MATTTPVVPLNAGAKTLLIDAFGAGSAAYNPLARVGWAE